MGVESRVACGLMAIVVLVLAFAFPAVEAQFSDSMAPAPAPTSDGTAIDQGIAYVLMMLALALTYIIHAADLSCS